MQRCKNHMSMVKEDSSRAQALPEMRCCAAHCSLRGVAGGRLAWVLTLAGAGAQHSPGSSEAALKLYTCAKCHVARYCGRTCQQAAWDAHRAACKRRQAHLGQVCFHLARIMGHDVGPYELACCVIDIQVS